MKMRPHYCTFHLQSLSREQLSESRITRGKQVNLRHTGWFRVRRNIHDRLINVFSVLLPTKPRILTIITLIEVYFCNFFSPYFVSCTLWIVQIILIPLCKVPINCHHAFFNREIVAVVDNRFGHATKNRFNDIKKLSTCRQRCERDEWGLVY